MALLLGIIVAAAPVTRSDAQPLVILAAVAKALSDAAASVDKFADGLTKLAKLGDFVGLPVGEAKRAQQRLLDMRARSTQVVVQQMPIFQGDNPGESLNDYIMNAKSGASPAMLAARWDNVRAALAKLVGQVAGLLQDMENERSGFVNEPAYKEFLQVLRARVSLLQQLQEMPAPTTSDEIRELEVVRDKYNVLITRLDRANDALAEYIRAAERRPPG